MVKALYIRTISLKNSYANDTLPLMPKILTTLLIAVTLIANLAWAMDTHAAAFFGHDSEWSLDNSVHPDEHDGNETCDHCCHGLAHLIGLVQEPSVMSALTNCKLHGFSAQQYFSRSQSPPIPPPNA